LAKIDYESFSIFKDSQPATAIKLYNRVIRHMSHELIYQKYNDKQFFDQNMDQNLTKMGVKDADLIIDLKFGDASKI